MEMATEADKEAFLTELRSQVGNTGDTLTARDPVNQSTIRNWCDAVSESNPYFTDENAAGKGPYGRIVAPPAMLQVWAMPGLIMGQQPARGNDPSSSTYAKLDNAGFISVVATNVEYVFHRYLELGDVISGTTKLVDVSEEKATGLGIGHFVTTETEYVDQKGEPVGSMFFRILKFRPGTGRTIKKEDFKNSILPGGYIGFGISIGKTNKKDIYWDAQITGTMHIISGYQIKYVPGYTFLGFTMGKRFTNTNKMAYLDLQANLWSLIQMGYGRGWLFYDNKRIPRKKMWIGLLPPIILTFDKYILDELIDIITEHTHPTGTGPSGPPMPPATVKLALLKSLKIGGSLD